MNDLETLLQKAAAERAEQIQKENFSGDNEVPLDSYLTFRLQNIPFAIPLGDVRRVIHFQKTTPVPGDNPYFAGVINWQGRLLTIVDIRPFFSLPAATLAEKNTAIITDVQGLEAGVLCDAVLNIKKLPASQLFPPPSSLPEKQRQAISGLYPLSPTDLLVIVNSSYLFQSIAGEPHG